MRAAVTSDIGFGRSWLAAADFDKTEEDKWAREQILRVIAKKRFILNNAARLRQPLSHALAAPGKFFRALLLLGHAALIPKNYKPNDDLISAAAAIELLHDASLLHDDVVDHSMIRRGQASVANAFNIRTAAHAGSYQVGYALKILARACDSAHIELDLAVLKNFAKGQLMEILPPAADPIEQFSRIRAIVNGKTGTLFLIASELGCEFYKSMGGPALSKQDLRCFSEKLALAYQIRDDILDLELGQNLRRPGNNDISQGTLSWPMALWIYAQPQPQIILRQIRRGDMAATARERLRMAILRSDAIDNAQLTVQTLIDEITCTFLSYPSSFGQQFLIRLCRQLTASNGKQHRRVTRNSQ